jgi:hypothetical protein
MTKRLTISHLKCLERQLNLKTNTLILRTKYTRAAVKFLRQRRTLQYRLKHTVHCRSLSVSSVHISCTNEHQLLKSITMTRRDTVASVSVSYNIWLQQRSNPKTDSRVLLINKDTDFNILLEPAGLKSAEVIRQENCH